jgi:FdhD protein
MTEVDTDHRAYQNAESSPSLQWTIQRIQKESREELQDRVVLEEPLEIVVNGRPIAVLMRMPGQEKELAAGFCVSEGYVRGAQDILLIHHCGLGLPEPGNDTEGLPTSRNRVEVRVAAAGWQSSEQPDVSRLIRSGCGAASVSSLAEGLPTVSHSLRVDVSVVLSLGQAVRKVQNVHHEVGGTHAAALFDCAGSVVTLAEDIGRHNAVDKVIGHLLLRALPMHDKILVTSGRASYEMVAKAIRVGIPVVASMSAPTSLAVSLAQNRGLTLIGYLRGGRMNVYTHAERLVATPDGLPQTG